MSVATFSFRSRKMRNQSTCCCFQHEQLGLHEKNERMIKERMVFLSQALSKQSLTELPL